MGLRPTHQDSAGTPHDLTGHSFQEAVSRSNLLRIFERPDATIRRLFAEASGLLQSSHILCHVEPIAEASREYNCGNYASGPSNATWAL